MLAFASLSLQNPGALWPVSIGAVITVAFVAWAFTRTPGPTALRSACATLQLFGSFALLACLLEPVWTSQRAKPGANLFAVIADNSQSMKLRSGQEHTTRGEAVGSVLTGPDNAWRTDLSTNFGVRNYLADSRLHATDDFHELNFEGRASRLGAALRTVADRYRGQPLAGVLLLTDGAAGDLDGADLHGLPPVYPVLFGEGAPARDVGVLGTSVTQTSFEDAPVTVQADVSATGCAAEQIQGKLFAIDPANPSSAVEPVAEQTLVAPADGKLAFRFQFRPPKTGVLFYRVRAAAKREWNATAENTSEATLANNEAIVTVDRGSERQRILYLAGRPNWEYKFLRRAIAEDRQTQLVGLIRIAKREAKFEFRGRSGESSNPLFRGFGNQSKEDIEQYDQPVLVRLDTEDEFELRGGFPKTAEELFKYRAVIIGDVEAGFFTPDQMSLLQRFVSERGGGFLMHGGAESFIDGKFDRTAIGDLLPIYLDQPAAAPAGDLHLNLTREGWLQPWARLRDNEPDEKKRLGELPNFLIFNRSGAVKPAAMVVATVTDGQTQYPALVTQRFGRGRTAALLVGDLWHLGLGDEERQKDLQKAWRQIVRWLVADVPEQIELRAEPQPGEEVVPLQVRAHTSSFDPLDNASVTLKVTPLGATQPITLTATPSTSEPGLYEASYVPHDTNGYRVEATVTDENGAVAGRAKTGWTTDLTGEELRSLAANRPLMESVAQKTGGEVLTPTGLATFIRQLPAKHAPITELWTQPLWHTPAVFLLALGCFVAEWGLRRWKGLP